jgi:hypothetical protein
VREGHAQCSLIACRGQAGLRAARQRNSSAAGRAKRSERNVLPVRAILEESCFSEGMPPWDQLSLNWSDLAAMPRAWRAKLAEWRGIYFIFDGERRAGYVGSAYGKENILGRWTNYADTGHGGNKGLRASNSYHLIFSILERTSPDMLPDEVIELENAWKQRLHTREFGLNAN